MPIRLHDSLTRTALELKAAQPDGVFRFYNCGPTVYAAAHIGNFRTFVVNDLIRRLAELEFGKDKVHHVRNITDVDDKTIRRSREENRTLSEVTRQWTGKFHADCDALNCLRPHDEPRATDPRYMREQVGMINILLEKGNAYTTPDGSVYFKVSSYPAYGALSRVKERELKPGAALAGKPEASAADADEKEDGSDFALWKAHKPEDGPNQWPGPRSASAGRPGWHIECSAMSKSILGPTIDLHTGGADLLFPHHENEIAQSQCCNGQTFSHHWYHSEHLMVDGRKMAKALGNLYTLDQLVAMGHTPMALRYALLSGHPRKQLNFTLDSLHAAEKALATLRAFVAALPQTGGDAAATAAFFAALHDDLNTPAALGALFTLVNRGPAGSRLDAPAFARAMFALGLKLDAPATPKADAPADVLALAEQRWAAKKAKDFAAADRLRAELAAKGWTMLDGKDAYKLEKK
jgi:cysteinyl-tRNA synthetase